MPDPVLQLACQFVSDPIACQRLQGTVRLRIFGQSLDAEHPATWAIIIRVVSRDSTEERGVLLPLTTGGGSETFSSELRPHILGPLRLTPVDARQGDRIVVELGSLGPACVKTRDDRQTWFEFSADILFEDLTTHLKDARTNRKIGRCIYCGKTEKKLSREHIIPEGLNGNLTLTAASCARHRDVTSKFEQDVLRNTLGPARIAFRMRSKRRKERPTHLPMVFNRDGKEVEIKVPVDEYPVIIAFPLFAPPGYLTARSTAMGINLVGTAQRQIGGLPLADIQHKYGGDYVGVRIVYQPVEFARTIAKIGYGYAVLNLGLEHIAERYVMPALLGESTDIGRWVGCDRSSPVSQATGLHSLTIRIEGKEIHVLVRLFAQFEAPEYHVVVGRLL